MEVIKPKRRKYHIIYKTTCSVTGKWYIGLHSTDNLDDGYQGSGSRLWKSIKKHGKDQHQTEILEHCADRATLILREAEIVNDDLLADPQCMNVIKGGNANAEEIKILREEAKRKCKQAADQMWAKRKADPTALAEHIKKIATPEIVAKRAEANTGKKRTPEQLKNLKQGQQRYYSTVDKETLNERGQKAAKTRAEDGSNRGGRPLGIPQIRASCMFCRRATITSGLKQFHSNCMHT